MGSSFAARNLVCVGTPFAQLQHPRHNALYIAIRDRYLAPVPLCPAPVSACLTLLVGLSDTIVGLSDTVGRFVRRTCLFVRPTWRVCPIQFGLGLLRIVFLALWASGIAGFTRVCQLGPAGQSCGVFKTSTIWPHISGHGCRAPTQRLSEALEGRWV